MYAVPDADVHVQVTVTAYVPAVVGVPENRILSILSVDESSHDNPGTLPETECVQV